MTRKSHYTILGVTRSTSPEGIRAAFLRLAKERHPDRAGDSSTPAFRELQQAYDVLSDPERRRRYDREFDRKPLARHGHADPLTRYRDVEPLVPDPRPRVQRSPRGPMFLDDLLEDFDESNRAVADRSWRPTSAVDFDAAIPAELAQSGGRCTLDLPFREVCDHCGGTGIRWPSSCPACSRTGWIVRIRTASLQLPPGVPHGTVVHFRSGPAGGPELRVRLLVGQGRRAPPTW